MRLGLLVGLLALAACSSPKVAVPPPRVAPSVAVAAAVAPEPPTAPVPLPEPVAFEKGWRPFGPKKCTYLAPKGDFIAPDGGIDVVFHFHAGQMSEREMKESGVRGLFVSCAYGIGTSGYSRAFDNPERFGQMIRALGRALGATHKRNDIHVRHLALVSWSAGFAAVNKILAVPEWYAATDAVVLLDSLHTSYVDGRPQIRTLRHFARFANDAVAGKKVMVITHSGIVPPGYASTTEATEALLHEIGVPAENVTESATHDPGWGLGGLRVNAVPTLRADAAGLHVRGFRGTGPHDHFDHLHLVGDTLRSWVVPRWYTPASERP